MDSNVKQRATPAYVSILEQKNTFCVIVQTRHFILLTSSILLVFAQQPPSINDTYNLERNDDNVKMISLLPQMTITLLTSISNVRIVRSPP